MFKTLPFRSFVLMLVIACCSGTAFGQSIWSETFTDQASSTTNWTSGGTNMGATPQTWTWTDDPGAGFQTNPAQVPAFAAATASTGYFFFNSDANGAGAHDVTLTGPASGIDCSGKTDVRVRFNTQFIKFNATSKVYVGVSTDGTNFTDKEVMATVPVQSIAAGLLEVPIPEANNQATVWIRFRWAGDYEYHWKVDDIEVFAPVSTVTFRVNTSLITVDPAGMQIAGDFNNWSGEAMTDAGGGVWTFTKDFAVGQKVLYKFKNGPNGWEGDDFANCGEANGLGGFNRVYTTNATGGNLAIVCFNSCDPCAVSCANNPNAIICDDMETYTVGTNNISAQAAHWRPWAGSTAATNLTNSDVSNAFASNGTKSMKVRYDGAAGDDQLLLLQNKAAGHFGLKWKMYVASGKGAYFNIQNSETPGQQWNSEIYFQPDGVDSMSNPVAGITSTYPHDTWFSVEHDFDLDNNICKLYINGSLFFAWNYTGNIGGIDFYSPAAAYEFYVDEVEYVELPPVVFNVDICDAAVDLTPYFGGAPGVNQVTPIQDNTSATSAATDPSMTGQTCWSETTITTSMWYTFPGDGERYHIETVPCTTTPASYIGGTNPNTIGDTQMAIFSGDDCSSLTLATCVDDLFPTGTPDWRAGLDIETVAGENYYMMLDGYALSGVTAKGEFCIQITKAASITCDQGAVGAYDVAQGGFVCWGQNLNEVITISSPDDFVIPTVGPTFGLAWALTTQPVPANTWPNTMGTGVLVGATGFLNSAFVLSLPNDGSTNFNPGVYYLTPIVAAGVEDGDPNTAGVNLFDGDVTNGCFFVGESTLIVLTPELNGLGAEENVTFSGANTSIDITPSGGLAEVSGDPGFYVFEWSNGAGTEDLTNVPQGAYSVTISDLSGCIDPLVLTFNAVGTEQITNLTEWSLSPNPTNGMVSLKVQLENAGDLRATVVNSLGQTMQTRDFGKVSSLKADLDFGQFSDGVYFLRLTVDGKTTQRSVVVSH